jgi:hypothetical protein
MGYSGARETLIYEKNLMSKISCQTPLKIKSKQIWVDWNVFICSRELKAYDCCMLQKCTSEQVSQFSARNDTFEDDWEDWDKPDTGPASPEGK